MTNQEAIDYIGTIHVHVFNDGKYKCAEACEMAISALQAQETHGDLISRQAALDCVTYDEEYTEECIKALPSAQPNLQPTCNELAKDTNVPCKDTISRQAAIDAIKKADVCMAWTGEISVEDAADIAVRATKRSVIGSIEDLPSAQPEIIACGDCKHWICHDRRCGYWNHGVKPLEWCSHAERRKDG